MTPQEARQALAQLAPEQQTGEWLESKIRYETQPGIHTYHACACQRKLTRSGWCSLCLADMLAALEDKSC